MFPSVARLCDDWGSGAEEKTGRAGNSCAAEVLQRDNDRVTSDAGWAEENKENPSKAARGKTVSEEQCGPRRKGLITAYSPWVATLVRIERARRFDAYSLPAPRPSKPAPKKRMRKANADSADSIDNLARNMATSCGTAQHPGLVDNATGFSPRSIARSDGTTCGPVR